jgi:hypothetical protein
MVRAGVWCENTLGMQVLSIGRSADDHINREDCVMEICGRWLARRIALRGGWIWLSACLMDSGNQPEPLVNFGDGEAGWTTICQLIAALERSGIRSLQPRPLEIGPIGPHGFVIQ